MKWWVPLLPNTSHPFKVWFLYLSVAWLTDVLPVLGIIFWNQITCVQHKLYFWHYTQQNCSFCLFFFKEKKRQEREIICQNQLHRDVDNSRHKGHLSSQEDTYYQIHIWQFSFLQSYYCHVMLFGNSLPSQYTYSTHWQPKSFFPEMHGSNWLIVFPQHVKHPAQETRI